MAKPLILRLPKFTLSTFKTALINPKSQAKYLPKWAGSWRNTSPLTAQIPWISFDARNRIEEFLTSKMNNGRVFEYGLGGSTLWYARRAQSVDGVEHDPGWYQLVQDAIKNQGITNCFVKLVGFEQRSNIESNGEDEKKKYVSADFPESVSFEKYVTTIDCFEDGYFDLVVVDGRSRQACLSHAISKVAVGGCIYLDDADRARYQSSIDSFDGWDKQFVGGIRPLSTPNYGILFTRTA